MQANQNEFIQDLALAATWGRFSHTGGAVVLFFRGTLPYGLGCRFQKQGLKVIAGEWYGVGRNAGRAVKIDGPSPLLKAIVDEVKKPKSRGSRTAGNLLPW